MFLNLFENVACFFGGHLVCVRGLYVGECVVIRVVDCGFGILFVECECVFEVFYCSCGDDGYVGFGFGFVIVKGFVEGNGGCVRVESVFV